MQGVAASQLSARSPCQPVRARAREWEVIDHGKGHGPKKESAGAFGWDPITHAHAPLSLGRFGGGADESRLLAFQRLRLRLRVGR